MPPRAAAASRAVSQVLFSPGPSGRKLAPLSTPVPYLPAMVAPAGEEVVAMNTGMPSSRQGWSWQEAFTSLNQPGLSCVTSSPCSRRSTTPRPSSSMGRSCVAVRPSWAVSGGVAPGPTPSITRPRVRWSSSRMRSASM